MNYFFFSSNSIFVLIQLWLEDNFFVSFFFFFFFEKNLGCISAGTPRNELHYTLHYYSTSTELIPMLALCINAWESGAFFFFFF